MEIPPDERATMMALVVEDAEEAYELVADLLADHGFSVVGASNGIDAVSSAVALLPDVILMDLSLPVMGGLEATRLLKADPRTREIPIIAVTGHHNFLSLAREAGCDAFVAKPFTPAQLFRQLRRTLTTTAQAASGVRPAN